ncbi:rRNA maturation RNase YbeY [Rhodohalobacter sp. 8-1]|uniref:rRNA maturation RNase YbeY n=1 Tax=Rhodohalobacter sp. 8-1 TaxID=3131972 RepID=UPI0030EC989C
MMTTFPEPEAGDSPSKLEVFNPSGHTLPFQESDLLSLLESIEKGESVQFHSIEFVFTGEAGIVDINSTYLDRSYVTDIISFRLDDDESDQAIEGTLYCCAPRIAEQSEEFDTTPEVEFLRVAIHGMLHLAGYDDQTDDDKAVMTSREDYYLQTLFH